jgi:hypothetical protein
MITIFILIYLVSLLIYLIVCYRENKYAIFTVGDLIDNTEFFVWIPLINTVTLILFGILIMITKITNLLKLSVLWEKFRNIKLK